MTARATVRRVRVYTRLSDSLRNRLSGYCEASGIAEREVFEAALQQYLDSADDMSLVLRRLDRLGRAEARTHRELELLSETFAIFVRIWFAHTACLEEAEKPAARENAEGRYRQFVEHVAGQFTAGHRFLDDLPHGVFAHDDELAAIASGKCDTDHDDRE